MPWNIHALINDINKEYSDSSLKSYWEQEQSSVQEALKAISESLDLERFKPKGILGVGGSGIVIRIEDLKFPAVDKALKFPRPVPGKVNLLSDLLNKEIKYLAEIKHPGIVRILNHDSLSNIGAYASLPYYMMDCIDGDKSREYVKNHPQELVLIIESITGIIKYLHCFPEYGFVHLDIKPDNFVVTSDGRVIMIDLGTCKRINGSEDSTTVACTRSFAHPELLRQLTADPSDDNRAKGDLIRSCINPKWDLWSFALSILSWLGLDHQSGNIEHNIVLESLEPYTRKYLFFLVARILAGPTCPRWLIKRVGLSPSFLEAVTVFEISELYDLVGRLSGSINTLERIPQFTSSQTDTIQAAPSQYITITPAVKKVIEHLEFRYKD